jgi:predicted NBD/HSP70 family sugar kinase
MTSLPTGSPPVLRQINSALLLRAIRERGPISRAELARATGLSKPTVNEVSDALLRADYVTEYMPGDNEHPRRPGPRARLLRFRADLGHVAGIDIGADKLLVLIADLQGEILASVRRPVAGSAEAVLRDLRAAIRVALKQAGAERRTLQAAAVGTPGVVDPGTGRITLAPQLEGWEGLALGARLQRVFPCPVLVENEVQLSVLGERWRGAGQGLDRVAYVQLGVGIGAGALIDGVLYRGATGAAGEIGYLPLDDGERPEGGAGPFEYAAGGGAFARLGAAAAARPSGSVLRALAGGDPSAVDARVVFAAVRQGDASARAVVRKLTRRLARGIASLVLVLDPEAVIIGGGLARAGELLREPLERELYDIVPLRPRLLLSTLADEGSAYGAVQLALQTVDERLFAFAGAAAGGLG